MLYLMKLFCNPIYYVILFEFTNPYKTENILSFLKYFYASSEVVVHVYVRLLIDNNDKKT